MQHIHLSDKIQAISKLNKAYLDSVSKCRCPYFYWMLLFLSFENLKKLCTKKPLNYLQFLERHIIKKK